MAYRFAVDETKEMQKNPTSQDPIVGRVNILITFRKYKIPVTNVELASGAASYHLYSVQKVCLHLTRVSRMLTRLIDQRIALC